MAEQTVLAVDLGAASGRVMAVHFDGQNIRLEEIHRFVNQPVQAAGTLHWDVLRLWHEIQEGLRKAPPAAAIGVDTWGVDFALLDHNDQLLGNPVHHRDSRTQGMMEWVFERVPRRTVFDRTGIQFIVINSLYQLASLKVANSPQLEDAATFLTMPDLLNFWLSGVKACEFSNATTTQCFNPRTSTWDYETLNELHIPTDMFPEIVPSGTILGTFNDMQVIAPACHDTGSAVVAVPTTTANYAYLSSGTWSLLGLEVPQPVINDASYKANVTNEGGAYGTFRLLKNVMGLWIVQQCRATWADEGQPYEYDQLVQMAADAEPFTAFIDPDASDFFEPGDMPSRVKAFCQTTNQPVPETHAQILRVVFESLAFKYRYVLEKFMNLTNQPIERLHIIGGGSQNRLLSQMTANAIGRIVITGPKEATALGNAIVQLITLGELENIQQARMMLAKSVRTVTYEPQNSAQYNQQYKRFQSYLVSD